MCAGRALVFLEGRFWWLSVELIVFRGSCSKAVTSDGETRAFSQGRLEPFGNLAVY